MVSWRSRLDELGPDPDPDEVLFAIVTETSDRGLDLYPAQEEAIVELLAGSNVVLSTPTGSGKSLVALAGHVAALAAGVRSVYTAPIKALVSEKFFALVDELGADSVGMLTGDAAVNPDAPVICCTAEVLANQALREGKGLDVGLVVMDEFHFYADPARGWAWQVPLLELPQAQFLLMSATLGDVDALIEDLTRRTGRATTLVAGTDRPVPLHHYYSTTPLVETIADLVATNQTPIYIVHFAQAAAVERAQALMSTPVASREQRDAIAAALGDFRFGPGFGRTLSRFIRHGVGVHHAGMLPRYRRLVEQLAQQGLLSVICGTDTLGVGINVPIRTVLLTGLSKYDGTRQRHLSVREFQQVAGRAGRAGFDTAGTVVVQAPEHEIENLKLLAKAGDDPKKQRKIVRKKAPDGFVNWTSKTHDRLATGVPESLTSRMRVDHATLINLLARPGDPVAATWRLLRDNHEPPARRVRLVRDAIAAYRSLLAAGVVEQSPEPDQDGRRVRLVMDLPENFALNQPLSPFALAAFDLLDPDSPEYALDVISVVESILDDPRPVLGAQEFRARGEAVAAMKAEGIEYEERMELLEDVSYPQPLAELLDAAFDAYRQGHPWVAAHEPSPKSVVRSMWEQAMTFAEFISVYGLTRSEGTLLRYLSDAYRTLRQVVPPGVRTPGLDEIVDWLGELVRQTDSSLLEEWEAMTNPQPAAPAARPGQVDDDRPPPVSANVRAFRTMVRNALFRRVELAARRDSVRLGELDGEAGWDADRWRSALDGYFAEYPDIGTGQPARGPEYFRLTESGRQWQARQVFDDPEGDHDWGISAEVDLDASDEAGAAVLRVLDVGPFAPGAVQS
ncbi:MAG: DEAD/DEAH box helicase [Actinomycetales bacterium]